VAGLERGSVESIARAKFTATQWRSLFAVHVRRGKKGDGSNPALLGSYQLRGNVIAFTPRFPLVRGVKYRAVFNPFRLPNQSGLGMKPVVADFLLPRLAAAATTVVAHVYPSAGTLPENQLKFYLHFSAPMSQGDVYRHIKLLGASGKPVELPFLELVKELWDADGKRFTLFFDPGRIKRGLKPREELGPVLEKGKSYTLVIDRGWLDAEGNPLKESFRKSFKAGPPEDTSPDPRQWKINPPATGLDAPVTMVFPRPMDHALMLRLIHVADAAGKPVAGSPSTSAEETRWHFKPSRPWRKGKYEIVVGTTLEDLAGNNLERPFEVDVFRRIQKQVKVKTVRLPFVIGREE
jgi:hypothetical protein